MPKKQPRNAFYFYMQEFREEQKKLGVTYANMQEVAQAASAPWTSLAPQKRAKFEAKAKEMKAKYNVPERKYTSQGVPLSVVEAAEQERREAAEAERSFIANFVKQKSLDDSILDEDIYLIDVNWYCKTSVGYLIGEVALLRMSLRDGIKDTFCELVNPGQVPIGYMLDVKLGAKELGLPMPEPERRADYIRILSLILDYVQRGPASSFGGPLPPLYTMPDRVPAVVDFIRYLCVLAAEDETLFRVYQLDGLFQQLLQHDGAEDVPRTYALTHLKQDKFKYSPGLACKEHEEADKSVECVGARVQRWSYAVLDVSCVRRALPPSRRHLPPGTAAPAALRLHPAPPPPPPPLDLSLRSTSDQLDVSRDSRASTERNRTHEPLRMPTTDYSRQIRAPPELSLTSDEHFPTLAAGRGRGRTLSGAFGRMKM